MATLAVLPSPGISSSKRRRHSAIGTDAHTVLGLPPGERLGVTNVETDLRHRLAVLTTKGALGLCYIFVYFKTERIVMAVTVTITGQRITSPKVGLARLSTTQLATRSSAAPRHD
ncbi:hypothetical protein ColTof3_10585 [Colletotrichum tofieldiae]|nr:hypothetical protein ColTof3_10585 [Colletotrichum tofieldiae]